MSDDSITRAYNLRGQKLPPTLKPKSTVKKSGKMSNLNARAVAGTSRNVSPDFSVRPRTRTAPPPQVPPPGVPGESSPPTSPTPSTPDAQKTLVDSVLGEVKAMISSFSHDITT